MIVELLRARSYDEAIRKAEIEADHYAKESHLNPYGQRVACRFLGAVESFELFDAPGNSVEVWSSTSVIRPLSLTKRSLTSDSVPLRTTGPSAGNT